MAMVSDAMARSVLGRFPAALARYDPQTVRLEVVSDGLINATWRVGGAEGFILQRLHPVFGREVNDDIAALVPVLRRGAVPVPDICPADDGRWYVTCDRGEASPVVWRLLSALRGRTIHRIQDPHYARAAGAAIAKFHAALVGLDYTFRSVRAGAHDTDAHMAHARAMVSAWPNHRRILDVGRIVDELEERWSRCARARQPLALRAIHGDLKISNILFTAAGEVSGIIDLDTMAWGTLDVEIGDMLRSWCNPAGEDALEAQLSEPIFEAATEGYLSAAGSWLSEAEVLSWVSGLERIALELASRFAADALSESYFGWSSQVAPTRGEHNLIRATNQLQLARAVAARRDDLMGRLVDQLNRSR